MQSKSNKCLRRVARFIATLAGIFWAFSLIMHVIFEREPITAEGVILGLLMLIALVGVVMAWRDEKSGGFILTISGAALSIFALLTAGRNHLFAMSVSGGPFLVAGILFLLCWLKAKK